MRIWPPSFLSDAHGTDAYTIPFAQPQQEETLDIEEIPLEEENLDEGVDGRPLTPLAALPEQDAELVAQANAA